MHSPTPCKLCGSSAALLHKTMTDRMVGTPGTWHLIHCTNPRCGLAWPDPTPTPEQLTTAYASYYTHAAGGGTSKIRALYNRMKDAYLAHQFGYVAKGASLPEKLGGRLLASLPHRKAAFDASVMWLPCVPGGKVLEIGCGNGNLLAHLKALGWQVQGVEPDPKSAAIAQSKLLPVLAGELGAGSFAPQSFDAIVMSHVIEHIADPVALISICQVLLKPGGRLVMLTPNLDALGHRLFGRDWLHLDAPRHLNLFTQNALLAACRQAGFADVLCSTTLRDANWTLGGSLALRSNGHYSIGQLPRLMRLAGFAMMYVEWLWLLVKPSQAEELLVVAKKSAHG